MSTYINGTVTSGYGLYSSPQNPVTIGSSGYITNNTNRFSGDAIYGNTAATWAITNKGIVNATFGSSTGIDLASGGTVTNATGGHIYGGLDGVSLIGSVGTVSNAAGAVIAAGLNGIYLRAAAGTVSNYGAIEAAATNGHGIYPAAVAVGGDVTNAPGGLISGGFDGIRVRANNGTVTNSGTIDATAQGGAGVALLGIAGSVTNFGTIEGYRYGLFLYPASNVSNAAGALISGQEFGIDLTGTGMVTNYGTLLGTGSGTLGTGAYLKAGGAVINNANALLSGYLDGALVGGVSAASFGTVTNQGTIQGTGTGADGVRLAAYGYVINQSGGLIGGVFNGVEVNSSFATLNNSGTIAGTGTHSTGAYLEKGGAVINNANALLFGYLDGALVGGVSAASFGTVTNRSTIQGTGTRSDGVRLAAYGYVINRPGGLIGGVFNGVEIGSSFATLNNSGTIAGTGTHSTGAYLEKGGAVINNANALLSGYLDGALVGGVSAASSGIVTNQGTIQGTGTGADGVRLATYGYVINGATNAVSALISGSSNGVYLRGGEVINYGSVVATATRGVGVNLGFGTVTNRGTVTAGTNGIGIYLYSGQITNYGTIIAPGALAKAAVVQYGTFFNKGVLEGSAFGIELGLAGTATGTAAVSGHATASGTASGQVIASGSVGGAVGIGAAPGITAGYTVTVAGTVVGSAGTAVSLGGLTGRLIVDPGALFQGNVDGGGGASVLEIAASGAGSGGLRLGGAQGGVAYVSLGNVANFSALQIDPSATLAGSGALSFATLVNQGQVVVASGDSLALGTVASAASTGAIDLRAGGTIHFAGPVADQTLIFNPAGGSAAIDQAAAFAATLADFTASLDTVDLTGLAFAGTTGVGFDSGTNVLTVTEGGALATLQLDAETYTGITWSARQDAGSGTEITANPCYCRGTLILTERGEVAVEELAIGDRVITITGVARPIKWIGRRSYSGHFAFGQTQILPICVTAGALADGVPRRDLRLSPNHALYLEGVLIEARDLINGVSIVQAERVEAVEYFHVELDSHDVIIAEGAAAESFLDDDSRLLFHNAHEYRALYPDAPAGPARYCAPRRDEGWEIERARTAISRRAGLAVAAQVLPLGTLRGQIDKVGHRHICGLAQDAAHGKP